MPNVAGDAICNKQRYLNGDSKPCSIALMQPDASDAGAIGSDVSSPHSGPTADEECSIANVEMRSRAGYFMLS